MSAANKSGRQSATTLRRNRQQRSIGFRESLNQTGYVDASLTIKTIKSFKAVAKGVEVHHVTGGESRADSRFMLRFGTTCRPRRVVPT